MPKAYWIGSHMKVKDPEKLKKYAKLASKASANYGGVVLARGGIGAGKVISLEGFDQTRVAVTEFPSLQHAIDCFNSDDYKESMKFLEGSVDRDVFIVEALN